jgi:glycosyltransferase involved in cell wall biosynthesis
MSRVRRIAVLWGPMSGYFHAQFQALLDEGADLLIVHREADRDAPFDDEAVSAGLQTLAWTGDADPVAIRRALDEFQPDALLVRSWDNGVYRRVSREFKGRALRVLTISNAWLGTAKQWGGRIVSPFVLHPAFDVALLSGERQADFAAKLGFPAERLIWGMNACDHQLFARVAAERGDALPEKAFLFVGRLVPVKAIDVLAAAYRRYRDSVDDPWPLLVAGDGAEKRHLQGIPGVELLGFVQPADLPAAFARAGCLVLPSRFEPWALVIQEAAAAGLPIVCSRACGASTRLVLDGYNGVVVTTGDVPALTRALGRIHRAGDDERREMGIASERLALQYTPQWWARNLLRRMSELSAELGLPDSQPGPSAIAAS